jgi:hypothetical protein
MNSSLYIIVFAPIARAAHVQRQIDYLSPHANQGTFLGVLNADHEICKVVDLYRRPLTERCA